MRIVTSCDGGELDNSKVIFKQEQYGANCSEWCSSLSFSLLCFLLCHFIYRIRIGGPHWMVIAEWFGLGYGNVKLRLYFYKNADYKLLSMSGVY